MTIVVSSSLILDTRITDVQEKRTTIGGQRDAEGHADLYVESAGWYIYIGHVAIYAGEQRPDFERGDRVRIIVTKKRDEPDAEKIRSDTRQVHQGRSSGQGGKAEGS